MEGFAVYIVFLIILIGFLAFFFSAFTSKGRRGEKRVFKELKRLPEEYTIHNDVVLVTEKGTTQIDHIVVSPYGVFVIETKNYTGWIFGKEADKEWLQTIAHYENRRGETVERTKFLNPIRQNYGHVKAVEKICKDFPNLPIIPIVVFVGDAVFKNVQCTSYVIHLYELTDIIQEYREAKITSEEAASLSQNLALFDMRKEISNREHAQSVKEQIFQKQLNEQKAMESQYRVIIAGGRNFSDYALLKERCDYFLQNKMKEGRVVIVSGHASGADALGERYAQERHLSLEAHPADWNKHGRAAGPIRNAEMAEVADALIAFWDGVSRGTKNMIDTAKSKGLKVAVVRYE